MVATTNACCSRARGGLDDATIDRYAPMFKAIGDPVRLRLLTMIAGADEVCVCELTPAFELSDATISHHLKVLREAGLVDCERRGTWVYYRALREALDELSGLLGRRLTPA